MKRGTSGCSLRSLMQFHFLAFQPRETSAPYVMSPIGFQCGLSQGLSFLRLARLRPIAGLLTPKENRYLYA